MTHTILPDKGPEQQRIDDHTGNDSHIENVCSQGQQTSVCKEQALDQQHGRDGEKCRAAAQEPRQKNAAADMSADFQLKSFVEQDDYDSTQQVFKAEKPD